MCSRECEVNRKLSTYCNASVGEVKKGGHVLHCPAQSQVHREPAQQLPCGRCPSGLCPPEHHVLSHPLDDIIHQTLDSASVAVLQFALNMVVLCWNCIFVHKHDVNRAVLISDHSSCSMCSIKQTYIMH